MPMAQGPLMTMKMDSHVGLFFRSIVINSERDYTIL